MEQKVRYLIMIFLVIFMMEFVVGFLTNILMVYYNFHLYIDIIRSIIICPFLIFIVSYLIGRKFDVRTNLRSLIIVLLTSAYLGYFLSVFIPISGFFNIWDWVIDRLISYRFLYVFFVAFSALTLANFRHNDGS